MTTGSPISRWSGLHVSDSRHRVLKLQVRAQIKSLGNRDEKPSPEGLSYTTVNPLLVQCLAYSKPSVEWMKERMNDQATTEKPYNSTGRSVVRLTLKLSLNSKGRQVHSMVKDLRSKGTREFLTSHREQDCCSSGEYFANGVEFWVYCVWVYVKQDTSFIF